MNKAFKHSQFVLFFLLICSMLVLSDCGSKRSPTGGKEDVDKLKVLASLPEEFADISEQKIELTFSKNIDRASFLKGIYIYPPISNKKVYYDGNVVTLKFMEALEKDKNYYVTLTTRIKDIRGNALENNQTLVYKFGKLNNNRLSGNIKYEKTEDNGLPVQVNLLSSDSLWVMTKNVTGNSYAIDALNPMRYIMRAYIDKNLNGRYDMNQEPYQEHDIANQPIAAYDLNMAYADTVKPVLKSVFAKSNREFVLTMNKTIKSFKKISIQSVNSRENVQVFATSLELNKITVITSETDTTKWKFEINDATDNKDNVNPSSSLTVAGSREADKTSPLVLKTYPRNGASVNDLQPVLEVTFSEIIPQNMFFATLKEVEADVEIPFKVLSANSKTYKIQPTKPLTNYKTCMLMISNKTSDISGNKLQNPFKLVVLPLFRSVSQSSSKP